MSYGLKALFYKNRNDEKPKYEVEINGIVFPYNMINEYDFKDVFISEGYVDYQLEVSKDELHEVVISHYGEDLEGYMCELNSELLYVVFEGDECERMCLWIYEYD